MKLTFTPLLLALALAGVGCGTTPDPSAVPVEDDVIAQQTDDTEPNVAETDNPELDSEADPVDQPDSLPAVAGDQPVFVWEASGGCFQAGPNCARVVVFADGTVHTYRVAPDPDAGQAPEVTGSVDSALVEAWLTVVGETDIDALVDRAGPGELTAAFDGVDFVLEAPHVDTSLSSVDIEFSTSEPYFSAAESLARAALEAAPLELEMR